MPVGVGLNMGALESPHTVTVEVDGVGPLEAAQGFAWKRENCEGVIVGIEEIDCCECE